MDFDLYFQNTYFSEQIQIGAFKVNRVYVNRSVGLIRKRSKIPAMSKMELFLIIDDDYKLLTKVLHVPMQVLCYELFGNKP